MTMYGMDIAAVRQLATQLQSAADTTILIDVVQRLSSALESTAWVGPDREKFKSDWEGTHVPNLRNVAEALRNAATNANMNATQQEQTSSS